jgi:hypothetical protein
VLLAVPVLVSAASVPEPRLVLALVPASAVGESSPQPTSSTATTGTQRVRSGARSVIATHLRMLDSVAQRAGRVTPSAANGRR